MDRHDKALSPQTSGSEQPSRKLRNVLLATECVLLAVLYAVPFLLLKTARKHMMFYRYLIVKQLWWANDMLYCRLALTVLAAALAVYIIWNIGRQIKPELMPFRIVNIVCLAIAVIVMNMEPSGALIHFLLLIASWAAVLLSLLITMAVRQKG